MLRVHLDQVLCYALVGNEHRHAFLFYPQAHVIQANMLASRTKAALLSLEVTEHEPDEAAGQHEAAVSIVLHLWRAEMLMGVVEVDKEGLVAKAGCCALHQPGERRHRVCGCAAVC